MREKVKIKLLQSMLSEITKKYDYYISQQEEKLQRTFEMAVKDSLTGLYNRQYLDEYSKQALGKLARHENILVLIFIDLDNFKYVNDNYGHAEGDEVLKKVAKIFQTTFRNYDIVVRYGGDEFIVLVEDKKYSQEEIETTLHSLVERIEKQLKAFGVSASYGYAVAPNEADDIDELIEIADKKMYAQKQMKKCKDCT